MMMKTIVEKLLLEDGKTEVPSPSLLSFRKRRQRADDRWTSPAFAAGILLLADRKDGEKQILEPYVSCSGSWWCGLLSLCSIFRRRRSHYHLTVSESGKPRRSSPLFFLLRQLLHVCRPLFGRPATRVSYRGPRHARQIAPQVLRWLGIRPHANYGVANHHPNGRQTGLRASRRDVGENRSNNIREKGAAPARTKGTGSADIHQHSYERPVGVLGVRYRKQLGHCGSYRRISNTPALEERQL
jgi:hypothetical protein